MVKAVEEKSQIKAFRRHRGKYAHNEFSVLLNRGIQKSLVSGGMELDLGKKPQQKDF